MRPLPLLAALLLAGCVRSGPRPIRPAAEETVSASVPVTEAAAAQAITDLGLPLSQSLPGLIETDYFDITPFKPEGEQYPTSERLVRYRVIVEADTTRFGSKVAVLSIYSPFSIATGRGTSRRDERATPRDHPGTILGREIAAKIKSVAEGN